MEPPPRDPASVSRRRFLIHTGALTTGIAAEVRLPMSEAAMPAQAAGGESEMRLRVNGQVHALRLDPRVSLLDALRDHLGLGGSKKGCGHGQCGACTVLVDGRRINSCLALAIAQEGREVTTIEGLAAGGKLHPVQAAFVAHDGFQCGYCTPGQVISCVAMLEEARRGDASAVTADLDAAPLLDDAEIRERMSGNLCRCGAYVNIVAAARDAARRA